MIWNPTDYCLVVPSTKPRPTGTNNQNSFEEMWQSDTSGLPTPKHIFGHLIVLLSGIESIQLSGNVVKSPFLCMWHVYHTLRAAGYVGQLVGFPNTSICCVQKG